MTNLRPLACSLTSADMRTRRSDARSLLLSNVLSTQPIDNGLQIEFIRSRDTQEQVERFIALERECCKFLEFSVDNSGANLIVRIQGPREAADVIALFRNALDPQGE